MQSDRSIELFSATLLLILGGILLISCIGALTVRHEPDFLWQVLLMPGQFLYACFHVAALLVPFFFVGGAWMILYRRINGWGGVGLLLMVVPFFSFSVSMRLIFETSESSSIITTWARAIFTREGGIILFLLITALLIWQLTHIHRYILNDQEDVRLGFQKKGRIKKLSSHPEERAGSAASAASTDSTDSADSAASTASTDFAASAATVPVISSPPPAPPHPEPLHPESSHQDVSISPIAEESEPIEENLHIKFGNGHFRMADEENSYPHGSEKESEEEHLYNIEDIINEPSPTHEDEEENEYGGHRYISESGDITTPPSHTHGAAISTAANPAAQPIPYEELEDGNTTLAVLPTPSNSPILIPEEDAYIDVDAETEEDEDLAVDGMPAPSSGRAQIVPTSKNGYHIPLETLLSTNDTSNYSDIDEDTKKAGELLRVTLKEFNIEAKITRIRRGPVITMFEILPSPGVKLARITGLADNIALRLAASSIRIIAPIPGKHAVGIEIPNRERHIVRFGNIIQSNTFAENTHILPIVLGKNIPGEAQVVDLTQCPHLLIAGATGAGKSVCLNSLICSLLINCDPSTLRLLLIDPKIVELKLYSDIPHLLTQVITEPNRALQALQYCMREMEHRYLLLDSIGVRDIKSYNRRIVERKLAQKQMNYIVIVIDEFADLIVSLGKELENTLARMAAMSRAVGIHLVLATQRPSTDVITGLIKANIPSRIAFMVSSKVDSRIILDTSGAEQLMGQGDMLFLSAWNPFLDRIQGAFVTEDEVERITEHLRTLGEPDYLDEEIFIEENEIPNEFGAEDPLFEDAIEIVTIHRKASASYLQRHLKIGYNRAARMIEHMEQQGFIGPQNGSKPRDILI